MHANWHTHECVGLMPEGCLYFKAACSFITYYMHVEETHLSKHGQILKMIKNWMAIMDEITDRQMCSYTQTDGVYSCGDRKPNTVMAFSSCSFKKYMLITSCS